MTKMDRCSRALLQGMDNQRSRCLYPDVKVKVKAQTFPTHKFILSACSHFFQCLFSSGMKESDSPEIELKFPSLSAETFEIILNFVYSGRIEINEVNVLELWHAANMLQLDVLLEECELFQERRLKKENCVDIFKNAKALDSKKLYCLSWQMIVEEFDFLRKTDELLYLTLNDMKRLVESDKLTLASEDQIIDVIYAWWKADKPSRLMVVDKLFESSRISLASNVALLLNIVDDDGLQTNTKAVKIIKEAIRYKVDQANRHNFCHKSSIYRETCDMKNVLVTLSFDDLDKERDNNDEDDDGDDGDDDGDDDYDGYDEWKMSVRTMDGTWFELPRDNFFFNEGSLVSFGDYIFLISWVKVNVIKYNTYTDHWFALENPSKPGDYYLVAEGEFIYAIGGTDGNNIERLNATSEINQPGSVVWEKFSELEISVTRLAVVSTDEDTIVVFGRNKENPEESVVQKVDLRTRNCSVFLGEAPEVSDSSFCLKTNKDVFLLQQNGSLWRIIDKDDSKLKLIYVSCLWDEELVLHGATICNEVLMVAATVKGCKWPKRSWDLNESLFFSGVTIFNRLCFGLVNAVMPKSLLTEKDQTFAE